MVARKTVLVTRPEGQAGPLCAAVATLGYRPLHVPLLAVSPIQVLDAGQREIISSLEQYDHCLFVSSNAARFGLERLLAERYRWPESVRCYAVGDSTADALRARGLAVITPGQEMTSEGLLALPLLESVSGQRVLIVKGEGGRTALRETLQARGAQVDELRCYRRSAPPNDPQLLPRLRDERIDYLLISSGEALENLMALLAAGESEAADWHPCTLVVPSQRVAEQAQRAGWRDVALAVNASDEAMLAALRSRAVTAGEAGV